MSAESGPSVGIVVVTHGGIATELVADTKLWAVELARYGIRTGAIAPGFVDTPILKGMRPEVLETMLKPVPLRRVGTPEEIYAGVRFILECDYFTGRCIDIDGGMAI